MPPTTRTLSLVLCLLALGGCATLPAGKRDQRDPWERMNRATYKFNDKFDKAIARPVARAYSRTPQFVQTGVHNFFTNLDYPIVILNDLLQGQFRAFGSDSVRLLINTTAGIGGLFDPATTRWGLDRNERDLGQTFGKWGIRTGPYLVLPFLGPSDVRDTFGRIGDNFSTPRHYIRNTYWDYGLYLLQVIDLRARLLGVTQTLDNAYDPYAFMRNAYLQNRDYKVNGGQSKSEEEQEEKLLEEAGEDQPQSQPPQAQPTPQSPPPSSQPPQSQPPR